jgi:proteasome lid subunit RPN8/RPN11
MTENDPASQSGTWKAAQCPFTIEYSLRALDDIRLAVTDAFFSLPRGGAEIGGILLGQRLKRRLVIEDYVALDCEHAFGPSFALSPRDQNRLAELLATAEQNPDGLKPVGWYHSHTRSEIFLSEADQALHQRYFPEPWQVALVLRPHTFNPTKGGFFFRETDGSMHAKASYQEFALAPLPVRPAPAGVAPATEPAPSAHLRRAPDARGPVITVTAEQASQGPAPGPGGTAEPAAPASEASEGQPADVPLPNFLAPPAERRSLWLVATVLTITIGLAAAVAAYLTQNLWLPRVMARFWPAPQLSIGLNAVDHDGQLQIEWDGNSTAVRQAGSAMLEIDDGPVRQEIQLDARHLKAGSITYGRQGERIDIKLAITLPGGQQAHGAASFVGKLPERKPPPEDPEIRKQRDALAAEAAKLKTDLAAEMARTRKLAKSLDEVKKVLQEQQRKRLESQSAGK